MDNKATRQFSGCIIVFIGTSFVISSLGVILALVTESDLLKFFTDEDGESSLWWYKTQFWIVIAAVVVLLIARGKLTNLRMFNNFPYEEDDSEKK